MCDNHQFRDVTYVLTVFGRERVMPGSYWLSLFVGGAYSVQQRFLGAATETARTDLPSGSSPALWQRLPGFDLTPPAPDLDLTLVHHHSATGLDYTLPDPLQVFFLDLVLAVDVAVLVRPRTEPRRERQVRITGPWSVSFLWIMCASQCLCQNVWSFWGIESQDVTSRESIHFK